jgi:predicted DNA-binding transcriptional regulator AlpA
MSGTSLSPRDLSLPRFALRRDEAAASLAISETTFDKWVELKRMPRGHKIDGVMLWDTQEVREYWNRLKDGDSVNNPFDGVTA